MVLDSVNQRIKDLQLRVAEIEGGGDHTLCTWIYDNQIHPDPEPGFVPCMGGVITGADVKYPLAWAYLQTASGQKICVTEAQWQAMSVDVFRNPDGTPIVLADGTSPSWNGIGGVPRYVLDAAAKTLRVPDVRGTFAEPAGYDLLDVGGVHGDRIREIQGGIGSGVMQNSYGVFYALGSGGQSGTIHNAYSGQGFKASLVVPVGSTVAPRAYGVLPCVYLGKPAS